MLLNVAVAAPIGRDVEGTARISAAPVRFQTHFHVGEFFRSEILNRCEHRRKSRGIQPTATIAASCGDVSEDVGCQLIVQSQSQGGRMGLYLTLNARSRTPTIIVRKAVVTGKRGSEQVETG